MDFAQRYAQKREHNKKDPDFIAKLLMIELNEEICRVLEDTGMTRSDLAEKMGVHRQFITKLLNGNPNVTLRTLVKVAVALEAKLEFTIGRPAVSKAEQQDDAKWNVISLPVRAWHEDTATACNTKIESHVLGESAQWRHESGLRIPKHQEGRVAFAVAS